MSLYKKALFTWLSILIISYVLQVELFNLQITDKIFGIQIGPIWFSIYNAHCYIEYLFGHAFYICKRLPEPDMFNAALIVPTITFVLFIPIVYMGLEMIYVGLQKIWRAFSEN